MNLYRIEIDGKVYEIAASHGFIAEQIARGIYLESDDPNPDAPTTSIKRIEWRDAQVESEWNGIEPNNCQLCGTKIGGIFIDGKIKASGWGILCVSCHAKVGVGLGVGKGQLYARLIRPPLLPDKWVKIDG